MKFKKSLFYVLGASLIVTAAFNTDVTHAEGTYDSDATVTFTLPDGPVGPVDPMDPSEPLDEEVAEQLGNITGDSDALSLDFVSNIDFGSHEVDLDGGSYESTTDIPYIQVTDRRGPGEGWNVTARVTPFESEGTQTLPGATINLNNGDADSTSSTAEPVVPQSIVLPTDNTDVNVASAGGGTLEEAQGLGTWVIRWLSQNEETTNENVTLDIPASSATRGDHTATINWTLTDGPGS